MVKLSVIVPVYRVEATLERCVKSIRTQSFTDYELLLVDDGSPDRCPQICDELATQDDRISVIHQANAGLSAARNAGLRVAKGTYVAFVDSDDMLAADTLQPLMDELGRHPEYDIMEFPVRRFIGSPKESVLMFDRHVYANRLDYWLQARAYAHAYAWNKIYRRELFASVTFPVGKVFEDVYTLPLLLQEAKTVATTDKGLYLYCHNAGGITSTADGKMLKQLLDAHLQVLADTAWQHLRDDSRFRAYYAHVLNIQIDVYGLLGGDPELPYIPTGFPGRNVKLWMVRLMGVHATCRFFKYIHQVLR